MKTFVIEGTDIVKMEFYVKGFTKKHAEEIFWNNRTEEDNYQAIVDSSFSVTSIKEVS